MLSSFDLSTSKYWLSVPACLISSRKSEGVSEPAKLAGVQMLSLF